MRNSTMPTEDGYMTPTTRETQRELHKMIWRIANDLRVSEPHGRDVRSSSRPSLEELDGTLPDGVDPIIEGFFNRCSILED